MGVAGVPVPGMLPALGLAAQRGLLAWADLCVPAIELAEGGFDIPRGLATAWRQTRRSTVLPQRLQALVTSNNPSRARLMARPAASEARKNSSSCGGAISVPASIACPCPR